MRTTLKTIAVTAIALTLAVQGRAALDFEAWVHSVLHGAQTQGTLAAVVVAEATAVSGEPDRDLILSLINTHRRGASDAWCARLAEAIYQESTEAELDPLMVASIVAKESSFKSRVVSHAGAVGLMQLRPFVARDVARRGQVEWNGVETLHSPDLNVRLGILYYKELVKRFDGDQQVALAAYNRGPTRVSRQLESGTYAGSAYADEILDLYDSIRNQVGASKT